MKYLCVETWFIAFLWQMYPVHGERLAGWWRWGCVILIKCILLLPCNLPIDIAQKQVNYHEILPGIKRFAKTCKKGDHNSHNNWWISAQIKVDLY